MRLVLAAVLLCAAPSVAVHAAGLTCPADSLDKDGRASVLLFSALPLSETKFAVRWTKAQKELKKEFPGLRFEKTENLHITLVFVGMGWEPAKIEEMEMLGLDGPDLSSGALKLKGAMDLFGPKKHVAVLHFDPTPAEWGARLMKNRQTMTDRGFRKRDMFDDQFKAHVSLAFASKPEEQRAELERFEKWMTDHAARFDGLEVSVDRKVKPAFFVVLGKDEAVRFAPLHGYCSASALKN